MFNNTAFILALQLLTRLPTPTLAKVEDRDVGRSLHFYPVVGLILGLIFFALTLLIQGLFPNLNHLVTASLLLVFWCWITGGLHLDGLADTADAWLGGGGDKERTLAIMKDPRSGPAGVMSIGLQLIVKWSLLVAILNSQTLSPIYLTAIIWAPLLARCLPLLFTITTPYVRSQGLASALVDHLDQEKVQSILFVISLFALFILPLPIFFSITLILTVFYYMFRQFKVSRIGGFTGDTLGAGIEIAESLILLGFV